MRREEELRRLREMVRDIDICMLTTIDERGDLHSRPMSTNGEVEFDGDLWFFTYAGSHMVNEVGHTPKVNASFSDPGGQRYVSMTGRGEVVRDRGKMEELWRPQLRAWFPKGLDEPDIALLKDRVERAEYWDSSQSVIAHAVSLASSLVRGEPAQPGENKVLELGAGRARVSDGGAERDIARRGERAGKRDEGAGLGALLLLGGIGLGVGLMYLLDPEQGRRRRERVRDQLASLSTQVTEPADGDTGETSERARGTAAGTRAE